MVPKGVEHYPRADGEVCALLVEPAGTVNTGDVSSDRTAELREVTADVCARPAGPPCALGSRVVKSIRPTQSGRRMRRA